MFKKKKCKFCGKTIKDSYSFCPYCGSRLKEPEEEARDYGLLGKTDHPSIENSFAPLSPFDNLINKMVGSAFRILEAELEKINPQSQFTQPSKNIKLFINGREINLDNQKKEAKSELQQPNNLEKTRALIEKMSRLPKKEPKTKIKRLSDRVSYELHVPGVKSLKDVLMRKLEKSLEIKAVSDKEVYIKTIPLRFNLISKSLRGNKLILDFDVNSPIS